MSQDGSLKIKVNFENFEPAEKRPPWPTPAELAAAEDGDETPDKKPAKPGKKPDEKPAK
jgi:hypothetical protein